MQHGDQLLATNVDVLGLSRPAQQTFEQERQYLGVNADGGIEGLRTVGAHHLHRLAGGDSGSSLHQLLQRDDGLRRPVPVNGNERLERLVVRPRPLGGRHFAHDRRVVGVDWPSRALDDATRGGLDHHRL